MTKSQVVSIFRLTNLRRKQTIKKQIISLGLVAAISSSLFAYTYEIKEGWQLMGAVEEIKDLSVFNDTCVDYLWNYDTNETSDPKWRLHIANGVDYNYCGDVLTSLDKADGFWVKASSDCNITLDACGTCETMSDIPIPVNIEDDCTTCDTNIDENGTISHNGFTYGTVVSPYTGKTWLDRNLGASQVCTSINDESCYGDYYQWGRETDGHEKKDSSTTTEISTTITNLGSSYIMESLTWTTTDSTTNLRTANWSKTDGTSICPIEFRVPTHDELLQETAATIIISLKVPLSGDRNLNTGLYHSSPWFSWGCIIKGNHYNQTI